MRKHDSVHKGPSVVWKDRNQQLLQGGLGAVTEQAGGQVSELHWGDGGGREGQAI